MLIDSKNGHTTKEFKFCQGLTYPAKPDERGNAKILIKEGPQLVSVAGVTALRGEKIDGNGKRKQGTGLGSFPE